MPVLLLAALLFQGDPRLAAARRVDKDGWIALTLAGGPREMGYQHGALLAPEIDDTIKAVRYSVRESTGKDWDWFRERAKALYWDKIGPELQGEIEGIAEGLRAKGQSWDAWDVLAENAHIELEGSYLPWTRGQASDKLACSAMVATGSQTADGKPVIAHNMWWGYRVGERFRVMLDLRPDKGQRIVMDALPGFVHSGTDFAINGAGLMITETTIAGFAGYDPKGVPEFARMRRATQTATSLDAWAKAMKEGNNGGYANTWLMADAKTGEIGRLELGLRVVRYEKKRDGAFVGSNFPQDPELIAKEIPGGWDPDPKTNGCEGRRKRWGTLLAENRGKVDAERAKAFLADVFDENLGRKAASDGTLCGIWPDGTGGAVNSKVCTAEMALRMAVWGRMGVSDGTPRKLASAGDPYLRDIPTSPWTRLEFGSQALTARNPLSHALPRSGHLSLRAHSLAFSEAA